MIAMNKLYINVRKLFWLVLPVSMLAILVMCKNLDTNVDCNECYSDELDSADLIIQASTSSIIDEVSICVYNGVVQEENLIICYDYGSVEYPLSATYYFYARTNSYYSVEAIYHLTDGRTVIVTDGDAMETNLVSGTCEYDCWTIEGGGMDVRLNLDLLPDLK
jgi:hypothetical protein